VAMCSGSLRCTCLDDASVRRKACGMRSQSPEIYMTHVQWARAQFEASAHGLKFVDIRSVLTGHVLASSLLSAAFRAFTSCFR